MSKTFKEKVKNAISEIEYDKKHSEVHDYLRQKALIQVKPSNKEQYIIVKCGWCYETLEFKIPPNSREESNK